MIRLGVLMMLAKNIEKYLAQYFETTFFKLSKGARLLMKASIFTAITLIVSYADIGGSNAIIGSTHDQDPGWGIIREIYTGVCRGSEARSVAR
jgi:hypothetical protein